MASKGQGILEAQSTPNDTLSGIVGAVKGLAEAIMARQNQTEWFCNACRRLRIGITIIIVKEVGTQ